MPSSSAEERRLERERRREGKKFREREVRERGGEGDIQRERDRKREIGRDKREREERDTKVSIPHSGDEAERYLAHKKAVHPSEAKLKVLSILSLC